MNRWKKILIILAAVMLFASPAFAQARYSIKTSQPLETGGIFTDQDGVTMDYAVWVYGVTIYADDASSYIGLYDGDTTGEIFAETCYPKYEIGEPTQYETTTEWFTRPMYFSDGVGAIISVGVGFVHYGPEPTD
jgi:hypothetical protein